MGKSQSKTVPELDKNEVERLQYLSLQEGIDRFSKEELIEEIKKNIRRFGPQKPSKKAIWDFYLDYKPLAEKKEKQVEKLWTAAEESKFDTQRYFEEYQREQDKERLIKEKEAVKHTPANNIQTEHK